MLIFAVSLNSCAEEKKKPAGILPEETLIPILVDVHILEAQLEKKVMPIDSLAVLIKSNYNHLFERHQISEDQFMKTFNYYESHPDEMDVLYQEVINELTKMEAELQGEKVEK